MKKLKVNLNDYLKRYFTTLGLKGATNIEKHRHIIPINPFRVKPVFNRILLTGDTIGLADPITTEGISYAIESGQLAAKAVLWNTLLLVGFSLLPFLYGMGWIYLLGAVSGGGYFIYRNIQMVHEPTQKTAMSSFFASLVQLVVLLAFAVVDVLLIT